MTDTSAAELDATNAPGLYSCDVTQGETNADKLLFSGKSSTANVKVVPSIIYTRANNINDMVIDSSGILDVRLGDYPHGGNSATITLNTLETSTLNVSGGVVTITTMEITTDLTIGDDLIVTGELSATTNSLPWNAAWDAEVQSEAQDAITASALASQNSVDTLQGTASATLSQVAIVVADNPNRITKNTALSGFMFVMVDSDDHATPLTGLTVTATRSLDGAAFGACANAVAEVANGWYKIDLAAGDLNGNVVALKFTATGADARNITIVTQPT